MPPANAGPPRYILFLKMMCWALYFLKGTPYAIHHHFSDLAERKQGKALLGSICSGSSLKDNHAHQPQYNTPRPCFYFYTAKSLRRNTR